MSTTLTYYPSTVSINHWTAAASAYAAGGAVATAAPTRSQTVWTHFGEFGFEAAVVPETALLTACTVTARYKVSNALTDARLHVQALNADTVVCAALDDSQPLALKSVTLDALAGGIDTAAKLRNSTFEIAIGAERGDTTQGVVFSLDFLRVALDFTAGQSIALTGVSSTGEVDGSPNVQVAGTGEVGTLDVRWGLGMELSQVASTPAVGNIANSFWDGACTVNLTGVSA